MGDSPVTVKRKESLFVLEELVRAPERDLQVGEECMEDEVGRCLETEQRNDMSG